MGCSAKRFLEIRCSRLAGDHDNHWAIGKYRGYGRHVGLKDYRAAYELIEIAISAGFQQVDSIYTFIGIEGDLHSALQAVWKSAGEIIILFNSPAHR